MTTLPPNAAELQERVDKLERENDQLRSYLASIEAKKNEDCGTFDNTPGWDGTGHGLTKHQVARYSRQIVLPSFGVTAQSRLCKGSVLIVGAGGLGSPVALYLAAAGVGRLGLVDRDVVELSNIHRQIIHNEANVGVHKVDSAASTILALNSSIAIDRHKDGFTPLNAVHLVKQYDVVVDASDNPSTRYLINDACAIASKPLVSGAALGTDGQITVYCAGGDCPCYRCLFPKAPPPQNCARCVDAGVLGVLPGIIGTMQALEAIKLLSKVGEPMARKLLVVDGLSARYHSVFLRPRSTHCVACGDAPQIREETIQTYDYASFTGQPANDAPPRPLSLVPASERLLPQALWSTLKMETNPSILVDVRPPEQFVICHLPGAINAPWKSFDAHLHNIIQARSAASAVDDKDVPIYVVCRRGNDSQRAVQKLKELGHKNVLDVVGGMEAWAKEIDPTFPLY